MIPESILDKLKKIRALATSGIDGERTAAAERLAALCRKHGVNPDDLIAETPKPHVWKFRGDDITLLTQVVVMICDRTDIANNIGAKRQVFWITPAEAIDVNAAVDHFRKEWRKVRKDALKAFIQRNNIFGGESSDREPSPEELEEMIKIAKMAAAQERAEPWNKRIG